MVSEYSYLSPMSEDLKEIFSISTTRRLCSRSCKNDRNSSYVADRAKLISAEPTGSPEEPTASAERPDLASDMVPSDTFLSERFRRGGLPLISMTKRMLSTLSGRMRSSFCTLSVENVLRLEISWSRLDLSSCALLSASSNAETCACRLFIPLCP